MAATPLHWGAEALWQQLRALLPGLSVEVVERCSSTNTALLERARVVLRPDADSAEALVQRSVESAAFGRRAADVQPCLLVAEHQTGGRGRLGRGWQSSPGASLTFSLAMPIERADWSGLSLAVGLSVAQSLHPDIRLKWPNDLWWYDRKLAGILIETASRGEASASRYVVIGVGLNLLAPDATGLSTAPVGLAELLPGVDAAQALLRIAAPLVQTVQRFEAHGFAPFQNAFNLRDALAQLPVTLSDGLQGVAQGVDTSGALMVATVQGVQRITSAEVSVRPQPGPGYENF